MNWQRTICVGIDAGGTKSNLAFRSSDDASTRYLTGVGINVSRDGLDATIASCARLVKEACGGLLANSRLVLCAGIAGAGREHHRKTLAAGLKNALTEPAEMQISILTDAEIAYYAAHEKRSGLLVIMGTGSIILGRTRDGRFVRAGGWGYLLGDEAGGFRLAQAGLESVADAFDGGPDTMLQQLLASELGISSSDALIEFVYDTNTVVQQVAPLVLKAEEAGDAVAARIVNTQLDKLVTRFNWLLKKYPNIDLYAAFVGGLFNHVHYSHMLATRLQASFPRICFTEVNANPVDAALALAVGKSEEIQISKDV